LKLKIDYFNKFLYLLPFLYLITLSSCRTLDFSENNVLSFSEFDSQYSPSSQDHSFIGKFKLYIQEKGYSGSFKWYPKGDGHEMILLSAFNQIISKVVINDDVIFEHLNHENQEINKIFDKTTIQELKRILYSEYNLEPLTIKTKCCDILINEYFKLKENTFYTPKKITIRQDQFQLTLILNS
jgi:hypothetical protein